MKIRTIICSKCGPRPFHSFPKFAQNKKKATCSKCRYAESKKFKVKATPMFQGNNRLFAREK